jgi:hypothetical protein
MTNREKLESGGFIIGARDPRLNSNFPGRYMVAEPHDESELPTKDGSNGPWCVVGDDLDELITQAADFFEGMRA